MFIDEESFFKVEHLIQGELFHLLSRKLPKNADQEKPCNQIRSPVPVSILEGNALLIWRILFMRPESPFFDAHSIGDIEVSEFYKTFQSNFSSGGRRVLCVHGGRLGILMSSCWGGSRAI